MIPVGAVMSSFELSGSSSSWNAAKPGLIQRPFVSTMQASPAFVLGEIEKSSSASTIHCQYCRTSSSLN